ncbi:hypothetical protein ACJQWK_04639 [Exserohilum turcicum]
MPLYPAWQGLVAAIAAGAAYPIIPRAGASPNSAPSQRLPALAFASPTPPAHAHLHHRITGTCPAWAPSPRRDKDSIIGVRRDCFGCGHTCISCKELFIRTCKKCKNEYCREDNDASSDTMCDWCNYTSRRTVEMY